MNDAAAVRVRDREAHLAHRGEQVATRVRCDDRSIAVREGPRRSRSSVCPPMRFIVKNASPSTRLSEVVDGHDARVLELSLHARLAKKAAACFGRRSAAGLHDLHRDVAADPCVRAETNLAHAAHAEHASHRVARIGVERGLRVRHDDTRLGFALREHGVCDVLRHRKRVRRDGSGSAPLDAWTKFKWPVSSRNDPLTSIVGAVRRRSARRFAARVHRSGWRRSRVRRAVHPRRRSCTSPRRELRAAHAARSARRQARRADVAALRARGTLPVPMKVPPHLERPGSLMTYPLGLPTGSARELAPAGSRRSDGDGRVLERRTAAARARERGDDVAHRRRPRAAREAVTDLPPGLDQALSAVAGELGMASASWVFVRAVARCSGDEGVSDSAEKVGAEFVVLDAVARSWLAGAHAPSTDPATRHRGDRQRDARRRRGARGRVPRSASRKAAEHA